MKSIATGPLRRGGGTARGVCHICVARACTHKRRTNDTHAFPQTTFWEIQTGLSKGGLSPKGANRAKTGPFRAISALPPWLWGAEELVPIGPEKAPTSHEMAPICPEKARFTRKDFPPIFSDNLGLKPPFVSPPLDFPNTFFVVSETRLMASSARHLLVAATEVTPIRVPLHLKVSDTKVLGRVPRLLLSR